MKLIVGIYDREVSHNLAVVLSSKKIIPIEAESIEEIPSLLRLHPGAMLLCEEISVAFYQQLKQENLINDVFLLFHPNIDTSKLFNLRQFGIKSLIPYTERAEDIIDIIIKQLSLLDSIVKSKDPSTISPTKNTTSQVAIQIKNNENWVIGKLLGLNSSKVSVSIEDEESLHSIIQSAEADSIIIYLQGLNIKVCADLIRVDFKNLVFRYRQMANNDAQRLAYFINYCQNNPKTDSFTISV